MKYYFPLIKDIRSEKIIKRINSIPKIKGAIILSCGNAYKSLFRLALRHNIRVIGLGTSHSYSSNIPLENRFYSIEELEKMYPGWFNATSGALSDELMKEIGTELYQKLCKFGYHNEIIHIPVGSGETLISLSKVLPHNKLIGFTCDDYPPIRMDYSYLSDELKKFKIDKLKIPNDVFKFSEIGDSILVTWR